MRLTSILRLSPVIAITTAVTVDVAPNACAGLIDGSLNNLHAADNSNVLNASMSSNVQLASNNHANNRSSRPRTEADSTPSCKVIVTVTDPSGASGTAVLPINSSGAAETPVNIPDQVPATSWHHGDLDHVAGQLICTDPESGAMLGMVNIDEDRVAA